MKDARITLLGCQDRELKEWLQEDPHGHERGAIVLFRRFSRKVEGQASSDRFVAVEVIRMTGDWISGSSPTSLTINMRRLPDIYARCEQEHLELGFVHNHSTDYSKLSVQDYSNEKNILRGLCGCNSDDSFLVSLMLHDGQWAGRIRQGLRADKITEVRHIIVLDDRIHLHGIDSDQHPSELLKRQEAAFGKPFNLMMKSLRVVVAGTGGTGSPAAILLARAGVRELVLIDGDVIEESNLNRVSGFGMDDVGKNKAEVLANFINELGIGTQASPIRGFLDETPLAIDAVSSADVVFGCTDDMSARNLINQAAYYYALPYIDLGLSGEVCLDKEGNPYLREHCGRVSAIMPEAGSCLRCQRVITDKGIEYEQAVKDRPELKKLDNETLAREHYLVGGREDAPGVGPFTRATADLGVATLMDLVKKYRDLPDDLRLDNIWMDFVHMNIHSNEPIYDPNCIYCGTRELLLKPERGYRLEIPRLGRL